jgi:hypothetical protein
LPPGLAPTVIQDEWEYRDFEGVLQGPFARPLMDQWFRTGYFPLPLLMRRVGDPSFFPLEAYVNLFGQEVFSRPLPPFPMSTLFRQPMLHDPAALMAPPQSLSVPMSLSAAPLAQATYPLAAQQISQPAASVPVSTHTHASVQVPLSVLTQQGVTASAAISSPQLQKQTTQSLPLSVDQQIHSVPAQATAPVQRAALPSVQPQIAVSSHRTDVTAPSSVVSPPSSSPSFVAAVPAAPVSSAVMADNALARAMQSQLSLSAVAAVGTAAPPAAPAATSPSATWAPVPRQTPRPPIDEGLWAAPAPARAAREPGLWSMSTPAASSTVLRTTTAADPVVSSNIASSPAPANRQESTAAVGGKSFLLAATSSNMGVSSTARAPSPSTDTSLTASIAASMQLASEQALSGARSGQSQTRVEAPSTTDLGEGWVTVKTGGVASAKTGSVNALQKLSEDRPLTKNEKKRLKRSQKRQERALNHMGGTAGADDSDDDQDGASPSPVGASPSSATSAYGSTDGGVYKRGVQSAAGTPEFRKWLGDHMRALGSPINMDALMSLVADLSDETMLRETLVHMLGSVSQVEAFAQQLHRRLVEASRAASVPTAASPATAPPTNRPPRAFQTATCVVLQASHSSLCYVSSSSRSSNSTGAATNSETRSFTCRRCAAYFVAIRGGNCSGGDQFARSVPYRCSVASFLAIPVCASSLIRGSISGRCRSGGAIDRRSDSCGHVGVMEQGPERGPVGVADNVLIDRSTRSSAVGRVRRK